MTQDVAAARVDLERLCERLEAVESSDPLMSYKDTTSWHRNLEGPQAVAAIRSLLARVAALEEGIDQARDLFTTCTDPDQFAGVTTFQVYRKMREWCARHPRANPQDERGRE